MTEDHNNIITIIGKDPMSQFHFQYGTVVIPFSRLGINRYGSQSSLWSAKQDFSLFSHSPLAPENKVSRDRFGDPAPSMFLPLSATMTTKDIYRQPPSGVSVRTRSYVPMAFTAASPPAQGQQSSRKLDWGMLRRSRCIQIFL